MSFFLADNIEKGMGWGSGFANALLEMFGLAFLGYDFLMGKRGEDEREFSSMNISYPSFEQVLANIPTSCLRIDCHVYQYNKAKRYE